MIHSIHDSYGNPQTNSTNILCIFTEVTQRKYDYIQVDEDYVKHMANLKKTLPHAANSILDAPVTIEELHLAVKSGKPLKAPGCGGICQEFFKLTWETTKHDMLEVLNQMNSNETIMEQPKHGILVCLPKTPTPIRREDYRPPHPTKCRF